MATILEAAARILERDGLAAFTTNRVADRAGVSIGSLYQYFPGKAALLAALIARGQEEIAATIEAVAAETAGLPLAATLRRLAAAAIDLQARQPGLAAALDYEESRLPVAGLLAAADARILAAIAAVLRRHRAALAVDDFAVAATDLQAMVRALVDAEARQPRPDWTALRERAMRAAYGYLTVRVPSPAARVRSR